MAKKTTQNTDETPDSEEQDQEHDSPLSAEAEVRALFSTWKGCLASSVTWGAGLIRK
jgi:hypothetical protein